ncbi:nickel-dependent hydrogenase large subunit [Anaerobacillus isosaccharinicus]|uniref:Hydrogenase n=1 Tax=Anaerobacillus isosaccharinicus TaxID=1532552 RepID=A0A1S2LGQ4_9BACI|nr:nickel-dependent hydrogenase large subunit [Anaerobacillus isosaccharinicus]MBA5585948.1 nickel-dependent hydrogenase large subunit [Anaerobacillus isosaccharinicus]QOY35766.1 nickel-dependent hydrogenase large subunit [Anaerobacillus isosaccharinicus]
MTERIVVDPVTRIEGHLRIEADIQNGVIQDAYSSGTGIRGIEQIVTGRDPRDVWAFVQRICGVCTTTHALASVRSVEDALDIKIPRNAQLIREIMNEVIFVHDHVVHFYHLHALDWVDVVSALSADPDETSKVAQSISDWAKSSPGYFREVQLKVQKIVDSGQLGIFANGYWGHEAYKLPPEVNLLAVAHYLEALDWQKEIVKIHAILGGKNPHPHYVVGGMATPIDINGDNAVNASQLMQISEIIDDAMEFVNKVYIPDLLAIGSFYKDWLHGGGVQNYMSYGDFSTGDVRDIELYRMPRGIILNGNLNEVLDVDPKDPEQIKEFIDHSWYSYDGNEAGDGKHPWEGETTLKYSGPKAPFKQLNTDEKYSWIKAPRWNEHPMEVGPLARIMVGYAKGQPEIVAIVDDTLKKLNVPLSALQSALGRTVARGLETALIVKWLRNDMDELIANIKNGDQITFNSTKWEPSTWPKNAKGVGWMEAPRGALGHWVTIEDGLTSSYQAVVPTTWLATPKDHKGQIGPYEAALKGTPVANAEQPLEILRIVHSFDPCLACAVHLTDLENKKTTEIRVG